MLEIDRGPDDAAPVSASEAALARDACRAALEDIARERERLPVLVSEAVSRGDFETASRYKAALSLIEDRAAFAQQQLVRAESVLLECEVADAEHEARTAADALTLAFVAEEQARKVHQEASAARAGAQAQQQALQMRVESLRREHSEARRTLEKEGP